MSQERKTVTREVIVTTCDRCGKVSDRHVYETCDGCGRECCSDCFVTHFPNPFLELDCNGLCACRECGQTVKELRERMAGLRKAYIESLADAQQAWIEWCKSKITQDQQT